MLRLQKDLCREPSKKTMALAHEHILGCAACKSPLILKGSPSSPTNVHDTPAVISYQHSIADILNADSGTPAPVLLSYLHLCATTRNGRSTTTTTTSQHKEEEVATTLLHVLHMEGLDSPATRRAFAEHCGLHPGVFEGHFEVLSRLTGAGIGQCWCACHLEDSFALSTFVDGEEEEDNDGFRPSTPAPVVPVKDGEQQAIISDGADTMMLKKRKRWSSTEARKWAELKRLHQGADTGSAREWTL